MPAALQAETGSWKNSTDTDRTRRNTTPAMNGYAIERSTRLSAALRKTNEVPKHAMPPIANGFVAIRTNAATAPDARRSP